MKKNNIFELKMKMGFFKASAFLLVAYFTAGTMFLPEGDFSTLPDLPKMYTHCKETEDHDMNLPDFITDHLLEIDGIFGGGGQEENEKPHQPVQFHHQLQQINFVAHQFNLPLTFPVASEKPQPLVSDEEYLSGYMSFVFRPPVA